MDSTAVDSPALLFACGHPKTLENTTRIRRNTMTYLRCRECRRLRCKAWRKARGPKRRRLFQSVSEALAAHLSREGEHLLWTGFCVKPKDSPSYPYATVVIQPDGGQRKRVNVSPRRTLWEEQRGPVPEGKRLYNTCGLDNCVEPFHQEARLMESALDDEGRRRAVANRYISRGTLLEIIAKLVDRPDDDWCWEWHGRFNRTPVVELRGTQHQVRHVLWELVYKEAVPPKKRLMACCGNPRCVKPQHMSYRRGAPRRPRALLPLRQIRHLIAAAATPRQRLSSRMPLAGARSSVRIPGRISARPARPPGSAATAKLEKSEIH